ncbi:hypothetical protein SPRG_00197 [Saprolegnia parasitica CBS 223.65]|uniref:Uncharacterized protein n=1 Tax=Saprolegnia parasitica (strain CBS 223.65) TaxID=695850 RepID=A0A067CXX5_SAPPC|nr:hypothetical protein SPRG_00197 [Saprolegnia parasitica CBS 223.65]KDO35348.1 hypothetical protein SPRG_00197 [Saprolegnia parasitica CBS 223.65]|eukprot:XP_012193694.1 hypothetical protein SPRG_00197 [Saprolegnia parasitica CBS 223.65]
MASPWIWRSDAADADISDWLDAVADELRPHQRDELQRILTHQEPSTRLHVWAMIGSKADARRYLHDVLRVHHYLALHISSSSAEYATLISLYAGFGDDDDRSSMESILTETTLHLSLLGRCLMRQPLSKQRVLLTFMHDKFTWRHFLEWLGADPRAENTVRIYLVSLPDNDLFSLWLRILVHIAPTDRLPWVNLTYVFVDDDVVLSLANMFQGHCALPSRLVSQLVALTPLELDAFLQLLVVVSVEAAGSILVEVPPIYYSALSALRPIVLTEHLDQWVLELATIKIDDPCAHTFLTHLCGCESPVVITSLYFELPATTRAQWQCTFHTLEPRDRALCTRFVLLIPLPTPPASDDPPSVYPGTTSDETVTPIQVIDTLVHLPVVELQRLLQTTREWEKEDVMLVAYLLRRLHPLCISAFLTLLSTPPATRELLYLVLNDTVEDEPRQLLLTLVALLQDEADAPHGVSLHKVLAFLSTMDAEYARRFFRSVLTTEVAFNVHLLAFVLSPPHNMVPMACLRLLLHLPSLAHAQLLQMYSSPAQSPFNLLVWSDLLQAVSSVSAATVLAIVQPLAPRAMENVFGYLQAINNEAESLVLMDLFLQHPTTDVLTFLELASGMTDSALKELNLFLSRLDLLRQSLLLPLFVDPRRAILSRLIVSCNALDLVTIGDVFVSLTPHTWETRSLLIEQVRMLEDPLVLSQYLALHKQASSRPNLVSPLAAYASLASYCSKTVHLVLIKALTRLPPSSQVGLITLLTTTGRHVSPPALGSMARPPEYWLDDVLAHCCRILNAYSDKVAVEIVRTLQHVPSSYHDEILATCTELTAETAFLIHMLRLTDDAHVVMACDLLYRPPLAPHLVPVATVCLQKMLKVCSLSAALTLLHAMPSLPAFLTYFDSVPNKMRLLATLADYASVAIPLLALLRIVDTDDANYLLHALQGLPPDRRARFEAQLLQEPIPPVLSADEKAIYFGILEGNQLTIESIEAPYRSGVRLVQASSDVLPDVPPWEPEQLEQHTLAAKPLMVRHLTPAVRPEAWRRPAIAAPLHLAFEPAHLPPLVAPRVCTASPERRRRGLQLELLPDAEVTDLHPRRRPTMTPGSPFAVIAKDPDLTTWPPTRIRVAKTPSAKQLVFDARIRKAMGTASMPSLLPSTSSSSSPPRMRLPPHKS